MIVVFFVMAFSQIFSITSREISVKNEDVVLKIWYQYEYNQKEIKVNCQLTNNSKESIFLRKYNDNGWDKKYKMIDENKFYYIFPHDNIKNIHSPGSIVRMHKLEPKKSILFYIYIEIDSLKYEELINRIYSDKISYYKYNKELDDFFNRDDEDFIPLKDDGKEFFKYWALLSIYSRSVSINYQFN